MKAVSGKLKSCEEEEEEDDDEADGILGAFNKKRQKLQDASTAEDGGNLSDNK